MQYSNVLRVQLKIVENSFRYAVALPQFQSPKRKSVTKGE